MTSLLSHWLLNHRDIILPQWIAMAEPALHTGSERGPTAQYDEQAVLLTSMYNGLIHAADGDARPLEQCLGNFTPVAHGYVHINIAVDGAGHCLHNDAPVPVCDRESF